MSEQKTNETTPADETPEADAVAETETEAETEAETETDDDDDDDVIDICIGVEPGSGSVAFDEPPEILIAAPAATETETDDDDDEDEADSEFDEDDAEIAISLSSRLARPENAEAAAASAEALEAVMADLAGEGRSPAQEVCAQLFSSHVPLTEAQLAENLNLSEPVVAGALAQLEETLRISPFGVFRRRLEVPGKKEPVTGFVLDLKPAYRARVSAVGRPVLSPAMTETLALIALNQPIGQSRLVRERGSSVYEHVKDLLKRDWIARTKKGRSYELRTTEAFAAEFGLPNDPELIKRALARAAGVEGTPDVIASERIVIEGAEGAPNSPELVEEARQAAAEVQDRIAQLMTAPQPQEDCVVSGGDLSEPAEAEVEPETVADPDALPPHVLAALRAAERETSEASGKMGAERSAAVSRTAVPSTSRPAVSSPWRKKEPVVSESNDVQPTEAIETPETQETTTEAPSRVAHLLSLLGDDATNDDW